ncbi:MAG TPA: electron transfer flavoprotein subunit beta/FixA family protein [Kofleriaceae bacterium]|nr:electron transfer flavoprotein subunit beta/FixA family protein [Kofleriaceae bacterium]
MKILVPVKRVPDPTQKVKIKEGHIDLTGASWIVNTFDEYAVETALRLLENGADNTRPGGGEIVVVSIGPDDAAKELRTCLAMGADRAIHVVANDAEIDALVVVKALSSIIAAEKPDLVVMGKQAVDGDANQVGQMLAGKLGWPQATFAASIELAADKQSLLVGREVDGGVEYKRVPLHSVITVDLRIVGPKAVKNGVTPESHAYSGEGARLPSLKGIMAAKKKPMAVTKLADHGASPSPVIKETSVTLPPPRPPGQIVADIPTLVKKLADEAKAL